MVEHPRGNDRMIARERVSHVRDAFARANAELVGLDVDRMPAQLRSRQLHRVARARARFLEVKRDALAFERARVRLLRGRKNPIQIRSGQVADRKQMLHQLFSRFTIVPTPWSVSSSMSSEWGTRPSMMCANSTP